MTFFLALSASDRGFLKPLIKWSGRVLCVFLMPLLLLAQDSGPKAGSSPSAEKKIPLTSVFSTSSQEGLTNLQEKLAKVPRLALDQLHSDLRTSGLSNVCLVRAPKIEDSIAATHRILFSYGKADPMALPGEGEGDRLWLFVYLGRAGSAPPYYLVKDITATDRRIRFSFAVTKSDIRSLDIHAYIYYVPIPLPAKGAYSMELFDQAANRVALSRTIEIVSGFKKPSKQH
jgi:hypothetical protein